MNSIFDREKFDEALRADLTPLFREYSEENDAIELISLVTADGFPVMTLSPLMNQVEEDKLAAAASTLHSVSNAVAKQILQKQFQVSFIESEQGNIAFVSLSLEERDYVLAMSSNRTMNIATLRMLINRLAKEIRSNFSQ
jgi:predicted regulator of Ras-like GTPase activity (Roadblock/LC7/MglB family)